MSRGLGPLQRRVLKVIYEEGGDEGLRMAELKAMTGGDRSNLRRAVRTLRERKLAELTLAEETPFGPRLLHRYERCVRLTVKGYMAAIWIRRSWRGTPR